MNRESMLSAVQDAGVVGLYGGNGTIYQCPEEFADFIDWLGKWDVKSYLEIGCGSGQLLEVLRKNGFDAYGIDPSVDSPFVFKGWSSSLDVISKAKEKAPWDCIFIDADHSFKSVMNDYENYKKMCGIIAFHDINCHAFPAVRQAWLAISETTRLCCSGDIATWEYHDCGGIGAIRFKRNDA